MLDQADLDAMSELERECYWRGSRDLSQVLLALLLGEAPKEVLINLTNKIANFTNVGEGVAMDVFAEESCRAFRFLDLFREPDWIEEEAFDSEGRPILSAYIYGAGENARMRVWCRYCKQWHSHGVGEGHRIAHCSNRNRKYKKTGYFLKSAGDFHDDGSGHINFNVPQFLSDRFRPPD